MLGSTIELRGTVGGGIQTVRNLCRLGPRVYRILHRTFHCERCGAFGGEKCIGAHGRRIEDCHLDRKRLLAEWRSRNPTGWQALRDEVAGRVLSPDVPLKA